MKKKILSGLLVTVICISTLCACGSSGDTTKDTDNKEKKVVCFDEVKNTDFKDCVVQVLDIVFKFDTDDTTKASYIYNKIAGSSYDIEVSIAESGLVEAGKNSDVYVRYNGTTLFSFKAHNKTESTASAKDCNLYLIEFNSNTYDYYLGFTSEKPQLTNIWYAKGIIAHDSNMPYSDLLESTREYTIEEDFRDDYAEDILYLQMKLASNKKQLQMTYNFFVDSDNGTLEDTYLAIRFYDYYS